MGAVNRLSICSRPKKGFSPVVGKVFGGWDWENWENQWFLACGFLWFLTFGIFGILWFLLWLLACGWFSPVVDLFMQFLGPSGGHMPTDVEFVE